MCACACPHTYTYTHWLTDSNINSNTNTNSNTGSFMWQRIIKMQLYTDLMKSCFKTDEFLLMNYDNTECLMMNCHVTISDHHQWQRTVQKKPPKATSYLGCFHVTADHGCVGDINKVKTTAYGDCSQVQTVFIFFLQLCQNFGVLQTEERVGICTLHIHLTTPWCPSAEITHTQWIIMMNKMWAF